MNDFAVNLYKQFSKDKGNVVFSPYSIANALAILSEGADGNTKKEIDNVLGNFVQTFAEELLVGNSLWLQQDYDFLQDFDDAVKKFQPDICKVDFKKDIDKIVANMNVWIDIKTKGKIKNLISRDALREDNKFVIINAIYFCAKWDQQFNKIITKKDKFFLSDGFSVEVDMMDQWCNQKYAETETCQVLSMAYEGGQFSMLIILPKENFLLESIEKDISTNNIFRWTRSLVSTAIDLKLPKFNIAPDMVDLVLVLKNLGINDSFIYRIADFSKMDGSRELLVGAAVHKALIEVDEMGTVGAAVTAIFGYSGYSGSPIPPRKISFVANRPFLFMVRDNTNDNVLFMGRVENPTI